MVAQFQPLKLPVFVSTPFQVPMDRGMRKALFLPPLREESHIGLA